MDDQVASVRRFFRRREVDAERGRDNGPVGVGGDEGDVRRRKPGQQARDAAAQSALTAVSTVPASTARPGGTPSGTTVTASAGTTYAVWCG